MTEDEARQLLLEYYNAAYQEIKCPEWPEPGCISRVDLAEKSCIEAMTHSETIAEQQREIAILRQGLEDYAVHYSGCKVWKHAESTAAATKCTCGLDEVLNERA